MKVLICVLLTIIGATFGAWNKHMEGSFELNSIVSSEELIEGRVLIQYMEYK